MPITGSRGTRPQAKPGDSSCQGYRRLLSWSPVDPESPRCTSRRDLGRRVIGGVYCTQACRNRDSESHAGSEEPLVWKVRAPKHWPTCGRLGRTGNHAAPLTSSSCLPDPNSHEMGHTTQTGPQRWSKGTRGSNRCHPCR